ncbi:MAG: hypothetical protein MR782_02530 [Campylobacter sp.]|nr:hypothetical protein [Campylobacter sp.]
MKYFVRILAFLFISFSFCYPYNPYDLQDATNYFNDLKNNVPKIVPVTNFIIEGPFNFSDLGVDFNKYIGGSSSNTIVRPICNGCYLMQEPHGLAGYKFISGSATSQYIKFYPNHIPPTIEKPDNFNADDLDYHHNVWWYDSAPKNYTVALVKVVADGYGSVYVVDQSYTPGKNYGYVNQLSAIVLDSFDKLYGQNYDYMSYPFDFKPKESYCGSDREYIAGLCVRKGYDVPCLNPDYYFSEKLGKCIPKCVNPENGDKGYYNDEKGRCEFCSFGSTFDEETQTCSNWKCFELENKMERFDCLCREGGHGAGVSSKIFVTGAGTDCSITCEDGLRISTISNFNVFKQLFNTVFNGGYIQTTFNNPTQFCTVDNSTNIDLVDPSDSESEQASSQTSEQAGSKSVEQNSEQGGEQAGSQSSEKAGEKAGEKGDVSKGTIKYKRPCYW